MPLKKLKHPKVTPFNTGSLIIASANLLSASNGKGILEVDINENPLRSDIVGDIFEKNSGFATLSDIPGLGFEPNLKAISKYLVAH